jgi:hypothetical protein
MANSNRLSTSRGMASCAGYKRHSSPVLDSTLYSDSGDAVDDDCHMPEPQLSNPRKRQPSEQRPLSVNETSQPQSKKQKLTHPSSPQLPVAFWDNLSKVWLTKRALRELDRRNTASSPRLLYQQPYRFVTRCAYAELKKCYEST